jgi:hypothetical protein
MITDGSDLCVKVQILSNYSSISRDLVEPKFSKVRKGVGLELPNLAVVQVVFVRECCFYDRACAVEQLPCDLYISERVAAGVLIEYSSATPL